MEKDQYNALALTSIVVMAKIKEMKFKLFPISQYLTDLALGDFCLLTNFKRLPWWKKIFRTMHFVFQQIMVISLE